MIKVAICDDIREFRDDIERKLEIWSAEKGINISVRKFDDGVPLLHCLNDNGMFDMIFLDIEMEKLNGMETATRIRKADYITAIVFISQYEDYYKDAYNVHTTAKELGVYNSGDDVLLAKRLNKDIAYVNGSRMNIKITTKEDLDLLNLFLRK